MIDLQFLELPALALIVVCAAFILVSQNYRRSVFALAVQYVAVFILITSAWPALMAITKLIAGWIAGVVLGAAIQEAPASSQQPDTSTQVRRFGRLRVDMLQFSGSLFGLLAAGMVVLVVISITPVASLWVPGITPGLAAGGMLMIGLGALQLGMTANPLRVVLGLLTVLSGFEIVYAAIEKSLLVAGLLSGVTLGLALVGSYLVFAPHLKS